MKKVIPKIPGLCEQHEDELLSLDEMISQYEANAETHSKAMKGLVTLSPEWCWRRDLGVRAIYRAAKLRDKLWDQSVERK